MNLVSRGASLSPVPVYLFSLPWEMSARLRASPLFFSRCLGGRELRHRFRFDRLRASRSGLVSARKRVLPNGAQFVTTEVVSGDFLNGLWHELERGH